MNRKVSIEARELYSQGELKHTAYAYGPHLVGETDIKEMAKNMFNELHISVRDQIIPSFGHDFPQIRCTGWKEIQVTRSLNSVELGQLVAELSNLVIR